MYIRDGKIFYTMLEASEHLEMSVSDIRSFTLRLQIKRHLIRRKTGLFYYMLSENDLQTLKNVVGQEGIYE